MFHQERFCYTQKLKPCKKILALLEIIDGRHLVVGKVIEEIQSLEVLMED